MRLLLWPDSPAQARASSFMSSAPQVCGCIWSPSWTPSAATGPTTPLPRRHCPVRVVPTSLGSTRRPCPKYPPPSPTCPAHDRDPLLSQAALVSHGPWGVRGTPRTRAHMHVTPLFIVPEPQSGTKQTNRGDETKCELSTGLEHAAGREDPGPAPQAPLAPAGLRGPVCGQRVLSPPTLWSVPGADGLTEGGGRRLAWQVPSHRRERSKVSTYVSKRRWTRRAQRGRGRAEAREEPPGGSQAPRGSQSWTQVVGGIPKNTRWRGQGRGAWGGVGTLLFTPGRIGRWRRSL